MAASTPRSKTLLLVKNLSTGVTQAELTALFGKYGQLGSRFAYDLGEFYL